MMCSPPRVVNQAVNLSLISMECFKFSGGLRPSSRDSVAFLENHFKHIVGTVFLFLGTMCAPYAFKLLFVFNNLDLYLLLFLFLRGTLCC